MTQPGPRAESANRPWGSARPVRGTRRTRVLAVLAWLAVVSCALTGCGRGPQAKGAGVPPGSGRHATSPAKEVEIQEDPVRTGIEAGDASLASKVRGRLAGDPQLHALRIEVDAEAGRVTLWGQVGSAEQRAAAEQQARRTPGVASVINLLKIGS
jgi:osmotically-inducible protein OsmY